MTKVKIKKKHKYSKMSDEEYQTWRKLNRPATIHDKKKKSDKSRCRSTTKMKEL